MTLKGHDSQLLPGHFGVSNATSYKPPRASAQMSQGTPDTGGGRGVLEDDDTSHLSDARYAKHSPDPRDRRLK